MQKLVLLLSILFVGYSAQSQIRLASGLEYRLVKKGKGTIIAEYEPPHNLPPAMAELIVTERSTDRAWSATIVDLAVRGYVKIEEEGMSLRGKIKRMFIVVVFLCFVTFAVFANLERGIVLMAIVIVATYIFIHSFNKINRDYKILKLNYKKFVCSKNFKNLDGICNINEILKYVKKIL